MVNDVFIKLYLFASDGMNNNAPSFWGLIKLRCIVQRKLNPKGKMFFEKFIMENIIFIFSREKQKAFEDFGKYASRQIHA